MLNINLLAPGRTAGESFPMHLSEGTILTPAQVNEILLGRNETENSRLKNRWMLCGDVSRTMHERLRHAELKDLLSAVSVIGDLSQGLYVVLTHQLEDMQHRFVMPVYEPMVAQFVKSLETDDYVVALGAEGGNEALVVAGLPNEGWPRTREFLPEVARHPLNEMVEAFGPTVTDIARLDTLPALGGREVRQLSLSVVLPTTATKLAFADTTVAH